MTDAPKSKYTITDIPGGFLVQREGGYELGVTYGETYIHVGTQKVGLYQYSKMVDAVAEYFLEAQSNHYIRKADREEWTARIARALSRRMKPHWERIVKEIAPKEVTDLARLMWSSVHGDARILHLEELYTDAYEHLRLDLMKYHACRLIAKKEEGDLLETTHLLDRMTAWRILYSNNAVSPKAFNKTLDALPRAVSFHSINALSNVHLDQPITNRLHLLVLLCGAEHFHWYMHERTVLRATGDMILEAAQLTRWGNITGRSKTIEIRSLVNFVLDYPAPFNGDFIGLARRSAEWHRENLFTPDYPALPAETKLPMLDLDYAYLQEEGIEPLRTVGAVVEEGEIMQHCVGSYALRANQGHSFLFHIEHNGEWATAELDDRGQLQQVYGPHNTINSACKWGAECLGRAVGKEVIQVITAIPF